MKKLLFVFGLAAMVACKSDKKENETEDESYVIPSSEKSSEQTPLTASIKRGKGIYSDLCVTCHLPNGKGIAGTYPPLDGSNILANLSTTVGGWYRHPQAQMAGLLLFFALIWSNMFSAAFMWANYIAARYALLIWQLLN